MPMPHLQLTGFAPSLIVRNDYVTPSVRFLSLSLTYKKNVHVAVEFGDVVPFPSLPPPGRALQRLTPLSRAVREGSATW